MQLKLWTHYLFKQIMKKWIGLKDFWEGLATLNGLGPSIISIKN